MSDPSSADRPVVTRIAPSPTGSLHIGNARSALFNWLYARHTGGKFLIRIEDTDRARHSEAAVQVIFDSLNWLGLIPDAPPVSQFARADIHRGVVETLLERGWAYHDYMTTEEADEAKAVARAEGHALRSPWRDRTPGPEQGDQPFVIRFKTPMDGETVIDDRVRGVVAFPNKDLEDFVLLRTDGTPIYNLAVAVDDHDMGITHVIRGEEHLSNAARQILIYRAMGWEVPAFAHLPLLVGADGAKLSKRHGAQSVGEFIAAGYLPEAVRNYLARLGWGHGDAEIFSDAQAIEWFDLKDVVRSPARLDLVKLGHINNHYIRAADIPRLTALTAQIHADRGLPQSEAQDALLARAIPLVREGAKTLLDLADLTAFVLKKRPLPLDEKTSKLLDEEGRGRLDRLSAWLDTQSDWTAAPLSKALQAFAESEGVGLGKIGPALRGVLSGGAPAPDLASALEALGREESLGRIADALSQVQ
ncbi:MAG TPA: glutamate--tRNA ligase [Caulobacteraceae bacterium]|jgi:glutamyl-tRNA synthetase|nr:glutamate--tRNA ligase [Caulobacteraceae bacterium]